MNRKTFLRTLGLGAVVTTVAPKVIAEPKPTGIVMIPDGLSPEGMQNFIDEWRKQNGHIVYESDNERVYSFDEIFSVWPGNDILIYFKPEHEVYQKIRKSIESRIVSDKWAFSYYLPEHTILLPIKDKYRMSDFDSLILFLDNIYNKDYLYCEYEQDTFLRLIREKEKNCMHVDLFAVKERR